MPQFKQFKFRKELPVIGIAAASLKIQEISLEIFLVEAHVRVEL